MNTLILKLWESHVKPQMVKLSTKIYPFARISVACSVCFVAGLWVGQFKQPLPYVSKSNPVYASRAAILDRQSEIGVNEYQRDDLKFDPF